MWCVICWLSSCVFDSTENQTQTHVSIQYQPNYSVAVTTGSAPCFRNNIFTYSMCSTSHTLSFTKIRYLYSKSITEIMVLVGCHYDWTKCKFGRSKTDLSLCTRVVWKFVLITEPQRFKLSSVVWSYELTGNMSVIGIMNVSQKANISKRRLITIFFKTPHVFSNTMLLILFCFMFLIYRLWSNYHNSICQGGIFLTHPTYHQVKMARNTSKLSVTVAKDICDAVMFYLKEKLRHEFFLTDFFSA